MGRSLMIAALLYGWGHPAFEGRRPDAFDRPLREFHRSINSIATDTRRTLATFDDFRTIRDLSTTLRPLTNAFN